MRNRPGTPHRELASPRRRGLLSLALALTLVPALMLGPANIALGQDPTTPERPGEDRASAADRALVDGYEASIKRLIAKVEPAFIFIGGGSGVLVSADGLIVTNHHVAGSRGTWEVHRAGGNRYVAEVLGVDPVGDLALLKIRGGGPFPFLELGDSDALRSGDPVLAVGNPIGIGREDYSPTYTRGIVSVANRSHANYTDAIQTDASINPGNSGGPLINMKGEVIGINGMIQTRFQRRVNSGVGYAISARQVQRWIPRLKSAGGGSVSRSASPGLIAGDAPDSPGAIVVKSLGAAAKAGLRPGDVILTLDGRRVRHAAHLRSLLASLPAGEAVKLAGRRGSVDLALTLTVPGRKAPRAAWLGGFLREEDGGLRVERVVAEGPLAKAGLEAGALLAAWNGHRLTTIDDLLLRLRSAAPGDIVTLTVTDDTGSRRVKVTLGRRPPESR